MREVARQNESKICPVKYTTELRKFREKSPQIANNFVIF